MRILFGPAPADVPDVPGGPGGPEVKDITVAQDALEWLGQCCGLRWQNMTEIDLKLAKTPLFLPHIVKNGNPIEDATVCLKGKVGSSCMCSGAARVSVSCVFRRT